jgi:hypothetical protein
LHVCKIESLRYMIYRAEEDMIKQISISCNARLHNTSSVSIHITYPIQVLHRRITNTIRITSTKLEHPLTSKHHSLSNSTMHKQETPSMRISHSSHDTSPELMMYSILQASKIHILILTYSVPKLTMHDTNHHTSLSIYETPPNRSVLPPRKLL